jgi:hypothetical protein
MECLTLFPTFFVVIFRDFLGDASSRSLLLTSSFCFLVLLGVHPSEVFRQFRGRGPKPDALLRHSGFE